MSKIKAVRPAMALPGGTVRVEVEALGDPSKVRVEVGGLKADLVGASSQHLTVRIPQGCGDGLVVSGEGEAQFDLKVGQVLASELHSVANPVVDSSGNVYVTVSGTRGEKVPFSIFVISVDGKKDPFLADVINPTVWRLARMIVSISPAGTPEPCTVLTFDKQIENMWMSGLGYRLVFDSQQNLLVGDRGGKIYRINAKQEISVFCELEPSILCLPPGRDLR